MRKTDVKLAQGLPGRINLNKLQKAVNAAAGREVALVIEWKADRTPASIRYEYDPDEGNPEAAIASALADHVLASDEDDDFQKVEKERLDVGAILKDLIRRVEALEKKK